MLAMRLFKQHQSGLWFVFWTFDSLEYTVVRTDNMKSLVGSDPQELIKKLAEPEKKFRSKKV
jgi:regulator of protease activity HflC (stomatin/prohibitin superfamily)